MTVSELYDPAMNAFVQGPPLTAARKRHVAALVDDGSVVVLAGSDGNGQFVLGGETVDAALSGFQVLPGEIQARVETAGTIVGGGNVLLVAGYGPMPGTTIGVKDWEATTELYHPSTLSFSPGPKLAMARSNHTVTLLDDGRVLAVGGDDGPLASAELYGGVTPGVACTGAADCTSGFCVDGVCCDAACKGQCEACDGAQKGTCSPVTGTPHGARAVCAGSGKCIGACDGKNAAACSFPDVKASCAGSCDAAKGTAQTAYCDGMGSCGSPKPLACSPYACGADACKASCAADVDCATGFVCQAGKCVPPGAKCVDDHTTQANGKTVDCAPFKCGADGTCRETCASSADCANGFACGSTGLCTQPAAPPPASGSSGGCAITQPRTSHAWPLALLLLVRRRRRRSPGN